MSSILAVGLDESLLLTRAALLRHARAKVVHAGSADALDLLQKQRFDVVVLCHTLSIAESVLISDVARRHAYGVRIVQLIPFTASTRGYESVPADVLVEPYPKQLLDRVVDLIEHLRRADRPLTPLSSQRSVAPEW